MRRSAEKAGGHLPGGGTSLSGLFLVKGGLSADAMRMALRWFDDDAAVYGETHSLEGVGVPVKLHHISVFGSCDFQPARRITRLVLGLKDAFFHG